MNTQRTFDLFDDKRAAVPSQAHARTTDPHTSHDAAQSISRDQLRASQTAVLRVLREYGPTSDYMLAENYDTARHMGYDLPRQSPSGLRTRRKELVAAGFVVDSGERVTLPSGRKAIVWQVAEQRGTA